MDSKATYNSVDEYINAQPENIKSLLEELRQIIKQTVPSAKEVISYGMPAYKANSVLVYFAANKQHIGFYPTASPIVVFKDELTNYKTSKGAIQFPIKSGIPATLVKKIVEYRVQEDEMKALAKKSLKK
ncbi:MAG: DUF1801 domain-containing protein [Paludibacter sp.]|nr:DUF1801 domain-containing protein [Paludibacter sp.]